jgi:hypothetical protein
MAPWAARAWGATEDGPEQRISDYLRKGFSASLLHVRVDRDEIVLTGHIDKGRGELAVAELPMSSPSWTGQESRIDEHLLWVSDPIAASGQFRFAVPRRVAAEGGPKRDRLLAKWRLVRRTAAGLELASHARYADDVTPRSDLPPAVLRSKKGLGGFAADRGFVSDLDDLGIACVTVNIPLTFLHHAPGSGRTEHAFNGRDYYVDDAALARLDRTLRETASRDVLVLAILLVPPSMQFPDPVIGRLMVHPDYVPPGIFAMPNVIQAEGLSAYAAAIDVLAERYCAPDSPFGRIHHWIVHNEVDAGWTWTNAGVKGLSEYVDLYHASLRVASLVTRQYDADAEVLASLTHSWNREVDEHSYPARAILTRLLDFTRAEGDFAWGVAYHPYPESLGDPATWRDANCPHSLDAPFVTIKNIEVLAAWARRRSTWFRGERPRTIHLSEQGFNSPDYGDESLQLQAAAMAYAWKKISALPEIHSFEYHNWIDNRQEGGLRIGLRKFPDDATDPGGKKPIWSLYRALATSDEDLGCAFALPLVGAHSWNDVPFRGEIPGVE